MRVLLALIFGIVIGFSISQLLRLSDRSLDNEPFTHTRNIDVPAGNPQTDDIRSYEYDDLPNRLLGHSFSDGVSAELHDIANSGLRVVNATLANFLYNETRVLCWVLTGPKNHQTRAIHVQKTWGSRCNKLLFMSSVEDEKLGAVKLPVGEGRGNLWKKTREAFKYIYEHHFNDADWFLKADDDTYVIAENLRAFLYQFPSEAPVYFGCKFKPHVQQGYMSGGAGYVLSKEALRRFVVEAYPNPKICRQRSGGSEDKEMGYCLQNVGVVAGDSRDEFKRGRFFPSSPQGHIIPKDKTHWYWRYIFYSTTDGVNCCSDHAISFHYIQPNYFYLLDYLIYRLRPFGISFEKDELPQKVNMTGLLDKWRKEESDNRIQ